MMKPDLWRRILMVAGLVFGLFAGTARADSLASDWGHTPQAAVRLVVAPGNGADALRLGLDIVLKPGWKTYWRSPGDAGYPATIDWTGSGNITPGAWAWPVPTRFSISGLETFGYEGEVLLPIAARRADPTKPTHLVAAVDFLSCAVLCVPNHLVLSLDVPPGPVAPVWAGLIDRWAARVPSSGRQDLTILSATAGGAGKSAFLDVTVRAAPPLARPDLLVEGGGASIFSTPAVRQDADGDTVLRLTDPGDAGGALAKLVGQKLTLTVLDRAAPIEMPRAVSLENVPVAPAPVEMPKAAAPSLAILGLALLGGFILNFMPCVLPVLSIKLLNLVGHSGAERRQMRVGFLASAAGIIASFLLMAGILASVKAGGLAVGWGIQFQHPVFLAILAVVVVGFAGNLFGFFEIALPSWLAFGQVAGAPSLLGNFLTGAFATALATPCSAPFLGTAVGFALAGGTGDIFAIFACLGIGLASPYLAVAALPGLGKFLPRPGPWMLTLRRVLGVLLLGTSIWLLSVLAGQAGLQVAGLVGVCAVIGLVLLGFARPRLGLVAFLAALLVPVTLAGMPASPLLGAGWIPYDEAAIHSDVAAGKVVFLDVTARWCINCQVNEKLVLDTQPVKGRLGAPGVVAMRADWTRPDARIAALLNRHGRFGIPFNVVYGPGAPGGVVLPEVLTSGAVTAALAKAMGAQQLSEAASVKIGPSS
jgi:suppressor for copper-sensitivity B